MYNFLELLAYRSANDGKALPQISIFIVFPNSCRIFAAENVKPIKIKNMEVVTMEKKAFDLMMARYDALVQKVELLKHKANGKRLNQWLTGPEVCQQLRISPRTLQKLRDHRFLGHTQFGRQFYYDPDEVKALVPLIARIKSV